MRRAAAADEDDAAAAGCVDDDDEDIVAILVRKEGVDVERWTQIVNPALDFAARRARAAGCCPSAADEMGAKSWGPLSTGLKGRYHEDVAVPYELHNDDDGSMVALRR